MIFKCKHKLSDLIVQKAETREIIDEDFEKITYHFKCLNCRKIVTKGYTELRGGVNAFLERGRR